MDKGSMMNQEIIKDALFRHAQSGGVTVEKLKAELKDIPGEEIDSLIENLMFGGQLEETDDGRLLMNSYF